MPDADARQVQRARLFRALHHHADLLVLPTAWDGASARLFASNPRCRAIATSSAGIAASLDHRDGEAIPPAEMLAAVARIARAVDVPVTADLEAGYAPDTAGVAALVTDAIGMGVVGVNLEDGRGTGRLVAADVHATRVAAARDAAERSGVPVVVNARVDAFWLGVGEPEDRVEETLARARRYVEAGADSVFVPGVVDRDTIAALADAIPVPLNVLAAPGLPAAAELRRLGVARLSFGSLPYRVALTAAARIVDGVLEGGAPPAEAAAAISYAALAELLA